MPKIMTVGTPTGMSTKVKNWNPVKTGTVTRLLADNMFSYLRSGASG